MSPVSILDSMKANIELSGTMHYTLAEKRIWTNVCVTLTCLFSLVVIVLTFVWNTHYASSRDPVTNAVREYSAHYFILCLIGGISAAGTHFFVIPIDLVKCRIQVGDYANLTSGFRHVYYHESHGRILLAVRQLFIGWVPCMLGYCTQSGIKFSLYEILKYLLLVRPYKYEASDHSIVPSQPHYLVSIFALFFSSFCAELIADIALAPCEALKIKIQTTRGSTLPCGVFFSRIWLSEGWKGFYKSLIPIWCRQIPSTTVKFASFEKLVVLLDVIIYGSSMATSMCSGGAVGAMQPYGLTATQLCPVRHKSWSVELFVSLSAAVMSGILCTIVSHPADTVLSTINNKRHAKETDMGGAGMTSVHGKNSYEEVYDKRASLIWHAIESLRELGWRSVWKGFKLRLVMVVIATALQWLAYDGFKLLVGLPGTGRSRPPLTRQ